MEVQNECNGVGYWVINIPRRLGGYCLSDNGVLAPRYLKAVIEAVPYCSNILVGCE